MKDEDTLFYIDTLGWYVTDKCNLCCALCVSEIPKKSHREDYPFELQKKVMKNYFDAVALSGKITITGGEPLLHSELSRIIKELMRYQNQFGVLNIITNGSVLPRCDVVDVLKEHRDKVIILVDNYGSLSSKIVEISALLRKSDIPFTVRQYFGENLHCNGWVDYGDYSIKRDQRAAQLLFSKCAIPSKPKRNTGRVTEIPDSNANIVKMNFAQMNEGVLCHCQRSYNSISHGVVQFKPEEYIDLMKDVATIRQALPAFSAVSMISACKYCNGLCEDSVRYTPAQQVDSIEGIN